MSARDVGRALAELQKADALFAIAGSEPLGHSCSKWVERRLLPLGLVQVVGNGFQLTASGVLTTIKIIQEEREFLSKKGRSLPEKLSTLLHALESQA